MYWNRTTSSLHQQLRRRESAHAARNILAYDSQRLQRSVFINGQQLYIWNVWSACVCVSVACTVCFVFELFDKSVWHEVLRPEGVHFFVFFCSVRVLLLNNYFMLNSIQIDWYFMNLKLANEPHRKKKKKIKCENCVCEMWRSALIRLAFWCVGWKRCENEIQCFHID